MNKSINAFCKLFLNKLSRIGDSDSKLYCFEKYDGSESSCNFIASSISTTMSSTSSRSSTGSHPVLYSVSTVHRTSLSGIPSTPLSSTRRTTNITLSTSTSSQSPTISSTHLSLTSRYRMEQIYRYIDVMITSNFILHSCSTSQLSTTPTGSPTTTTASAENEISMILQKKIKLLI